MKVTVKPTLFNDREGLTKWAVELKQGSQYFTVGYDSYQKDEIQYMAKMLRKAIRAHDKKRDSKREIHYGDI